MSTVDEIRRQKLAELAEQFGGVRRLADKIGRSESQVSQWINAAKDSKTGRPRGMRNDSARFIEQACNKPSGWLDGIVKDTAPPPSQPQELTPFESAVLKAIRDIPPRQRERFLGYLEGKIEELTERDREEVKTAEVGRKAV